MQIEGRNPINEALKADTPIKKILIQENIRQDDRIEEIFVNIKKKKINFQVVSKRKLDHISETGVHQGLIALIENEETTNFSTLIKDNNPFLIYIREALYEHNIGAIIRTAECAGATGVILPPKTILSPQVRRTSMGATEHIPITNYGLFQAIKEASQAGIEIVGIERTDNSTQLYKTPLRQPLMLIIGGEDRSLSESIIKKCDKTVQIPMFGKINSLNMSVAAALVIYEVVRQSNTKAAMFT